MRIPKFFKETLASLVRRKMLRSNRGALYGVMGSRQRRARIARPEHCSNKKRGCMVTVMFADSFLGAVLLQCGIGAEGGVHIPGEKKLKNDIGVL